MENINIEQLIQLWHMVEALTTKSGDINTSTVERINASNIRYKQSTSSNSQLIDTNHETVEQRY